MEYFSDSELGEKPAIIQEIDINVWNGIVGIIDRFIADNSLSKDFPMQCPDGLGVCGCETTTLYDSIKAYIPNIKIPIIRKETNRIFSNPFGITPNEDDSIVDTYATLDLIQFLFNHINDSQQTGRYHDFFNHYHLTFKDTGENKTKFRSEINSLFERNGIAYHLDEKGNIKRVIGKEYLEILKRNFSTKDITLNQLLNEATEYILLPKATDRKRAIEKLWDAFERAKTFYSENKKQSIAQLIKSVSKGNPLIETYINKEANILTDIGNDFQIRHYETSKQPIDDISHIDYFFFRLLSLINLFINELEK